MIKLTIRTMLCIILSGTCTTQSMENIEKTAHLRSHQIAQINTQRNNARHKVIIALKNPDNCLKFVPIKKRMSHTIPELIHDTTESVDQVTFDDFWRDINNQPRDTNTVFAVAQAKTDVATRNPSVPKPEYEYIQRFIEQKVIDISCCNHTFTDFKALRLHICKNHKGVGRTHSAQLKNGSSVWYSQAELAACRMVVDHYTRFFSCPACNHADFSNTICLKRHYKQCVSNDSSN